MAKKFLSFRKQISEIEDIKETVKALEKISAANIHFLKLAVQRLKDYEMALKKIFSDLAEEKFSSLLFQKNQNPKKLKVILTIQKGFCGHLLNSLLDFVEIDLKKDDKILVVGEKGKKLCKERKIKVDYFFPATEDIPKEEDTREIRDFVISQFLAREFGEISIIYPQFKSLIIQKPTLFTFLPFEKNSLPLNSKAEIGFPIYEPSKKEILDYLTKEYLGLVFYQKILETKLSELSAKTINMEEAGERAEKLVKNLWHQYFREKREEITKEISDVYRSISLYRVK